MHLNFTDLNMFNKRHIYDLDYILLARFGLL